MSEFKSRSSHAQFEARANGAARDGNGMGLVLRDIVV